MVANINLNHAKMFFRLEKHLETKQSDPSNYMKIADWVCLSMYMRDNE
jgi:hypothetical protein